MYKLLLLEDDINLLETVSEYLEEQGFEVSSYIDGFDAQDTIFEQVFDELILDVNITNLNGFELLDAIRKEGNTTPCIFTTSRNAIADVEEGFESGCDDYIRKPYALKELLLRVQTLLKREFSHNEAARIALANGYEYDVTNARLYLDDTEIHLQDKEHLLLKLFLQKAKQSISHQVIHQTLWTYEETPSDTALRTYVKNLRKLFGKDSIVSIKRIGYQFNP